MQKKTEKLKFGDILCIRLAKDEFYFSSPGFVSSDVELTKSFAVLKEDFQQSLFQIIPPLGFQTLQHTQSQQIKENQKSIINMDNQQTLEKIADELIEQGNVKNMNKGVELTYHQDFLLQHVSSKKILSVKESDTGSYNLTLEMIPSIDFTLNIMEFYKFRNNKENNISYNEKVLIKLALFKERYKSFYFDISDQAFANLQNVNNIDQEEIVFNVEDTRFTPVIFEIYESALDSDKQQDKIKAGDVVCIDHLKSQGNLYLNKQMHLLEKNKEILNQLNKKQQDRELYNNSSDLIDDSKNIYNFETEQVQQDKKEIEECSVKIMQAQKFKNCDGHWIVEKLKINQGGPIGWGEKFRLKNLENGKYLAFNQEDNNGLQDIKLQDQADENTEFFLEDEKGQLVNDNLLGIDYNETFSIQRQDKNDKEQFQAAEVYFDNISSNLNIRISRENLQVESFKFLKSTFQNSWELRFIKDCQNQLQKAIIQFYKFSNTNFTVSVQTKQCLDIVQELIQKIKDFIYSEGFYSGHFFNQQTLNEKRVGLFVASEIHDLIYLLIDSIFPNENCLKRIIKYGKSPENHENFENNNNLLTNNNDIITQTSMNENQITQSNNINLLTNNPLKTESQVQTNRKSSLKRNLLTKTQTAVSLLQKSQQQDETFNNVALVKQLKIETGEQLFPRNQIAKQFIQIVEGCYELLSHLMSSNNFPNENLKDYLNLIIQHTGYNLDIWFCLNRILSKFQDIDEILPRNLSYQIEKHNIFKAQNFSYLHLILTNCQYKSVLADLYLYLYIDVNPRSHHMTWETKIQNQRMEMISQKEKIESQNNIQGEDDFERHLFLIDEDMKVVQSEEIDHQYNPSDWVKVFKGYLLEFFEDTFQQDRYKQLVNKPGYYNYVLSMIKILTNLITLKEFDISDPDCEEDDQILKWIFHFLQELDDKNHKQFNLRSKAIKQGFGQSFSKPHLKTLQMDFQSNNNDSQLISSLKGLILDIYELKVRILQDQTIDSFMDHTFEYIHNNVKKIVDPTNYENISEQRLVKNDFLNQKAEEKCEIYALNNFIDFSQKELKIKESIQNGEEFEICSNEFLQMLFQQFQQSTEFELDFKLLKLIFFIGNRKSEFIKQLKKTQFIIQEERRSEFLNLNKKVEKMRQLQQRSSTWIQVKEKLQKKIAQTYLSHLVDIITMLENDYELMHHSQEQSTDDLLYITQKSLSSLNLQQVILEMIKENMTLNNIDYTEQQLIDSIYTNSFKLLRLMVKDNRSIKQEFINYMPLLMKLMKKKEYGQTQLVIDIYSNDLYTQQQISENMIDLFVHQIEKKVQQNVIDPSALRFFFKVISYQGDVIENNIKMIIDNIFFTKRAYLFFGMELKESQPKTQQNNNNKINNQHQFPSIGNQDKSLIQQKFQYRFKVTNNIQDECSYIYQANAFLTTREILMNSGNQRARFQQVLQTILDLDYLLYVAKEDSHNFFKQTSELNFKIQVFKIELLKLIQDVYLSSQDLSNRIFKYEGLQKFLGTQVKLMNSIDNQELQQLSKYLKMLRDSAKKAQKQQPYQIFIQTFYKRQKIKGTDMVYEQYEFINYIFDVLLPMMTSIKKALILKAQQIQESQQYMSLNDFLDKKGWGVLEDFADSFIIFFEEQIDQEDQIKYSKIYKNVLMEFKTIFQRTKPNIVYKNEEIKYKDINLIIEEEIEQNLNARQNFKTANISKNLPELRNILCLSRERYDSESFKNILVHILTNPQINQELVVDESIEMVSLLRQHMNLEEEVENNIQNENERKNKPQMNSRIIIDNLLKFIEIGISFMQNHEEVRKTVKEAIQLLCDLTESYEDEKELQKIQNYIFDSSLGRILMNAFGRRENYFDELLIGQILRLVIALTRNGNSDIQNKLIQMFKQNSKIEYLVNFIDQCIKGEIIRIENMNQNPYMKKYVILNQISYNYDKSDRHAINHCYNFIQSLNQNHFKPFQIFWRNQSHCNNSYDITDSLVKLIDTIVRYQFNKDNHSDDMMADSNYKNTINMNAYQKEMLKESLETILSLIQGKSIENKLKVLQSSLIENFKEIIKVNEFKIKQNQNILRTGRDELVQIRLLLQEFYEGILQEEDVVLIKNLCFEIMEHLTEDDNQLNENVLGYAFQIFLLIKDYDETNRILKACHISKKQALIDLKFYNAYMFFHKNTGSIELINENNQLQEITFAYLPHFNALNKDIQNEFEDKINRDSSQSKMISLMNLAKPFNQKLLNEQQFIDAASTNKLFKAAILLSQNQPYLRGFNFCLAILDNIYLLAILAPKTLSNGQVDLKEFSDGRALDDVFFQITLWVQNIIVFLLFFFFIIQNKSYIKWLINEQQKKEEIIPVDQNQVNVLQGVQKQKRQLGKFSKFKIWFNYWCTNQSVAYFMFFTPVLLLSNFYHELFVTLLLLDFLFRFPETQNVFKAFWAPKWKLLTNICLYLLFMYYFAILAYMTLQDYYYGTCENLLSCFSVIFDNAQKQRIAKLYATLTNYQEQKPAYLMDREDLFDFFFMLFVVSCIWTWTFTSLIIESYGNLRRAANTKQKDIQHVCLVCTLPREKVTKLCSYGFDKHQMGEHNQWNYLRYMASLFYKNSEQFTSTEKYVYEMIQKQNIHWFPIEKSTKFTKH
ncbi:MIR motif [Pseudocohnilembus persalinus]|uniref:MIR motif n=1 Tax=Pseudocohnilembus persalinus TaxID=266149 RepID=A0A0V0QZC4_PSEPJ|nr:MIR motif [Pseudocohnilembus persalinus]|eukprot:KRX07408.1 MIR motif [Pseudocohnilembus persalinus]